MTIDSDTLLMSFIQYNVLETMENLNLETSIFVFTMKFVRDRIYVARLPIFKTQVKLNENTLTQNIIMCL